MDIVSNSRIAEAEYTRWKDGRRGVKAPTLTVSECTARRLRMNKIVQGHKVTDACFVFGVEGGGSGRAEGRGSVRGYDGGGRVLFPSIAVVV